LLNLPSQHPHPRSGEPWPPGLELSNRIGAAFGKYDTDMSGTLTLDEIIAAFKDINLTSVSVQDIKKKFVEFDADNSGGLDRDEFANLMHACRSAAAGPLARRPCSAHVHSCRCRRRRPACARRPGPSNRVIQSGQSVCWDLGVDI